MLLFRAWATCGYWDKIESSIQLMFEHITATHPQTPLFTPTRVLYPCSLKRLTRPTFEAAPSQVLPPTRVTRFLKLNRGRKFVSVFTRGLFPHALTTWPHHIVHFTTQEKRYRILGRRSAFSSETLLDVNNNLIYADKAFHMPMSTTESNHKLFHDLSSSLIKL